MWKIIGASVAGTAHLARGMDCQDASGWAAGRDVTCLAAADGAGSRPLARRGAAIAVECALQAAAGYAARSAMRDPADWLRGTFTDVRAHIAATADAEGRDLGDYAATLVVVILTSAVVCVGQVGDTIAVVRSCTGQFRTLAPAPRGEYVNEADFITDQSGPEKLRVDVLPGDEVDAIVLSTDGLQFKILADLRTGAPFAPFFEDLVTYAISTESSADGIRRFLVGVDDQSGDDKTLIAAVQPDLMAPMRRQCLADGQTATC
jgi:hypothetical protein